MIKIEMLLCIGAVAQAGNLADAAIRLGRKQSAFSKTLKHLEEHLGQPLFESERKNRLSPLGHEVFRSLSSSCVNSTIPLTPLNLPHRHLPAEEVERLIADLIRARLERHDVATRLIRYLSASEVGATSAKLHEVQKTQDCLALVERADIAPGDIVVRMHVEDISKLV